MLALHARRRFAFLRMTLFCVIALAVLPVASAHEGPPFPLVMDKPLGGYAVSVWADPDIGEAQFFVVVELPAGGPPRETPRVSLWVEPASRRLQRSVHEMARQSLRNRVQFKAEPYFDRQDVWTVGIRLTSQSGEHQELTMQVESTPPGHGRWDMAIYLFPFLLLSGLWIVAMVRRSRISLSDTRYEFRGNDRRSWLSNRVSDV